MLTNLGGSTAYTRNPSLFRDSGPPSSLITCKSWSVPISRPVAKYKRVFCCVNDDCAERVVETLSRTTEYFPDNGDVAPIN